MGILKNCLSIINYNHLLTIEQIEWSKFFIPQWTGIFPLPYMENPALPICFNKVKQISSVVGIRCKI